MKALSIKQPWAWLIVNGHKDVENRSWYTSYRGPVLIHAGKKIDNEFLEIINHLPASAHLVPRLSTLDTGGIIGIAEIVGCVTKSESPWFFGEYGFLIRNARPIPFVPYRGQLGFFEVEGEPMTINQPTDGGQGA